MAIDKEVKKVNEIIKNNIRKSFGMDELTDLEKGKKTGYYTDTAANRKLGRVGQKYTKESSGESSDEGQKKKTANESLNLAKKRYRELSHNKGQNKEKLAALKTRIEALKESVLENAQFGKDEDVGKYMKDKKKKDSEIKLSPAKQKIYDKAKMGENDSPGDYVKKKKEEASESMPKKNEDAKYDDKLNSIMDEYPDDAKSWKDADDGIRDLAFNVREAYNELVLDVVEGDKGYVEGLNFREFKEPGDWNKGAKKQINELWGKMDSWAKKSALSHL